MGSYQTINNSFSSFIDEVQNLSHQKARKQFLLHKVRFLTLTKKEQMALLRIKDFFKQCDAANKIPVISFSGGKDSCVLRHLVHRVRKTIKLETATELFHPLIAQFISKIPKSEITVYPPLLNFKTIIDKYGYPCISKEQAQKINCVRNCNKLGNWIRASLGLKKSRKISRKYLHFLDSDLVKYNLSHMCCSFLKGSVKYSKSPKFVGVTIEESQLRRTSWLRHGCNFYSKKQWQCRPLSLFTEEDIWKYIKKYKIPYSKAYGKYGNKWKRTGCVCCGFGLNYEINLSKKGFGKNRIELLYQDYPNLYYKYMYDYGMARPFADLGYEFDIPDLKYKQLLQRRTKKINDWYRNLKQNLLKILSKIEKRTGGKFSDDEKNKILKKYGAN